MGRATPGATRGTPKKRGPKSPLTPDVDGLLRLERASLHAQLLLRLSQDDATPTKAASLTSQLAAKWSGPSIFNALGDLVIRGYAARLGHGLYVRRWAPLPAVH